MKDLMGVVAQWLSFVYIICATFGVIVFKGISLPFFTKTAYICKFREA